MGKKVYLIHGWGASSKGSETGDWYSYVKEKFEEKGISVTVFDMPETEHPKIETWVKYLEKNVKDVDENTYFIGHSVGCQAVLRFLEKLHKNKRVGGCIFVAGWFNLINLDEEEMEIAHPWINTEIDFNRIKEHTDNFLAIFSTNDPYVPFDERDIFKEKLGAKIIIKKNRGHFDTAEQIKDIDEIFKFVK